jgi:hypothetical protein
MHRYFALVPAAAVQREIDANLYAFVGYTIRAGGVERCKPRMVRANDARIENGVARVYIGSHGDGIAVSHPLPFGVVTEQS